MPDQNGMLLDRMSLSSKNEWYDDTGRVYIYILDDQCSVSGSSAQ